MATGDWVRKSRGPICLPCAVHVEVVTALQRDRARAAHLLISHSTSERDLSCHGSATDDGLVQAKFLDQSSNASDVGILVVGMLAWPIAGL